MIALPLSAHSEGLRYVTWAAAGFYQSRRPAPGHGAHPRSPCPGRHPSPGCRGRRRPRGNLVPLGQKRSVDPAVPGRLQATQAATGAQPTARLAPHLPALRMPRPGALRSIRPAVLALHSVAGLYLGQLATPAPRRLFRLRRPALLAARRQDGSLLHLRLA